MDLNDRNISSLKRGLSNSLNAGIDATFWKNLKNYRDALAEWADQLDSKIEKRRQIVSFNDNKKKWGIEKGIMLLEGLREILLGDQILYLISSLQYESGIPAESYSGAIVVTGADLLQGSDTFSDFNIESALFKFSNLTKQVKDIELEEKITFLNEILKWYWDEPLGEVITYYRLEKEKRDVWMQKYQQGRFGSPVIKGQTFGQRWDWWFQQTQNKYIHILKNGKIDNTFDYQYKNSKKEVFSKKMHGTKVFLYNSNLYEIAGNRGHELEAFYGMTQYVKKDSTGEFRFNKKFSPSIVDDIAEPSKNNLKYYQGPDLIIKLSEPKQFLLQSKRINASISLKTTYNGIQNLIKALDKVFDEKDKIENKEKIKGHNVVQKLYTEVVKGVFGGNFQSKIVNIAKEYIYGTKSGVKQTGTYKITK